jgi:Fe-S-cluster containining protein
MAPSYECDCCGACCKPPLIVELYEIDLLREPRLKQYATAFVEPGCDGDVARLPIGQPCPLLQSDNLCAVHPTRSSACVAMQPGDEQCQAARAACGLPLLRPIEAPTRPI